MIDISKANRELTKEDEYALRWLEDHGFNVTLENQYISKTRYVVSKYGMSDYFELQNGAGNMPQVMESFRRNWIACCRLRDMVREVS